MVPQSLSRLAACVALAGCVGGAAGFGAAGGLPPVGAAEPAFVMDLPAGGRLPGEFGRAASGDGPRETLVWRSPQFAAPLEFRLDGMIGIRGIGPDASAAGPGGFCCRLRDGDTIDGDLREIDATAVVLATSGGGPVRIARTMVASLGRRSEDTAAGYVGPAGLAGWQQSPPGSWRDEAGRIATDVPNATVWRDVGGAARARYDLTLSWRSRPELLLGVAAGDGKQPDPFRLEILSADGAASVAMLVRQERGGAKLEPVPLPEGRPGRLRLTLFVDRRIGRLAAGAEGAEGLVDLTLAPAVDRRSGSVVRLQLLSGDVCLERLQVTEWTSAEPQLGEPGTTRIALRSGDVLEGDVIRMAADGPLLVKTPAGEQQHALDQVDGIAFAPAGAAADPEAGGKPAGAAPAPSVRVVRRSGGVLTGDVVAVTDDGLVVARPGLDRTLTVPYADLQSLVSLRSAPPPPLPGRPGRLLAGEAELPGCLVDAAAWGGGLAWLPRGSVVASPLAGDPATISAVIEYVAPPAAAPQPSSQTEVGGIGGAVNLDPDGFFVVSMLSEEGAAHRDGRIEPGDRILAVRPIKDGPFVETKGKELAVVMNLLRGPVGTPVSVRIARPGGDHPEPRQVDLVRGLIVVGDRSLLEQALAEHARVRAGQNATGDPQNGYPALVVLRSGDVVPVSVEGIGAEGVRLRSPVTADGGAEAVTVINDLVRVLEFDPSAPISQITRDRFERLITLPRSQQADPPTHVLRLQSGDYLRGRLESLDAEDAVFIVLGQKKKLPRGAVARIIWLHSDEIDFAAAGGRPPEPQPGRESTLAAPPRGLIVQGVSPQGRATLAADRLEGAAIVGQSPAFGPSRIDTKSIHKLLVGRAVGAGDEELPFARWRLRLAPLPRALRAGK